MGGLAQVHGGALATLCLQPGLPLGTLGSPRVRVRQQADLGNLEGKRSWDPLEQKPEALRGRQGECFTSHWPRPDSSSGLAQVHA